MDRSTVADPAAELDPQIDGTADGFNRRPIYRAPGDGTVEIDDMQPSKSSLGKLAGLCDGVAVENRGARHIAAEEPHAGAVLEVDRRKQDHGGNGSFSRSL